MLAKPSVAILGALLLGPVLSPAVAVADEQQPLGVSRDRIGFHNSLNRPLFDPDEAWAPGEVRSATFFVRNRSSEPGDLAVELAEPVAAFDGYLTVSVKGHRSSWRELDAANPLYLGERGLGPRHTTWLTVRAELAWDAPNRLKLVGTPLDFTVSLADPVERTSSAMSPSSPTAFHRTAPSRQGVLLGLVLGSLALLVGRLLLSRGRSRAA